METDCEVLEYRLKAIEQQIENFNLTQAEEAARQSLLRSCNVSTHIDLSDENLSHSNLTNQPQSQADLLQQISQMRRENLENAFFEQHKKIDQLSIDLAQVTRERDDCFKADEKLNLDFERMQILNELLQKENDQLQAQLQNSTCFNDQPLLCDLNLSPVKPSHHQYVEGSPSPERRNSPHKNHPNFEESSLRPEFEDLRMKVDQIATQKQEGVELRTQDLEEQLKWLQQSYLQQQEFLGELRNSSMRHKDENQLLKDKIAGMKQKKQDLKHKITVLEEKVTDLTRQNEMLLINSNNSHSNHNNNNMNNLNNNGWQPQEQKIYSCQITEDDQLYFQDQQMLSHRQQDHFCDINNDIGPQDEDVYVDNSGQHSFRPSQHIDTQNSHRSQGQSFNNDTGNNMKDDNIDDDVDGSVLIDPSQISHRSNPQHQTGEATEGVIGQFKTLLDQQHNSNQGSSEGENQQFLGTGRFYRGQLDLDEEDNSQKQTQVQSDKEDNYEKTNQQNSKLQQSFDGIYQTKDEFSCSKQQDQQDQIQIPVPYQSPKQKQSSDSKTQNRDLLTALNEIKQQISSLPLLSTPLETPNNSSQSNANNQDNSKLMEQLAKQLIQSLNQIKPVQEQEKQKEQTTLQTPNVSAFTPEKQKLQDVNEKNSTQNAVTRQPSRCKSVCDLTPAPMPFEVYDNKDQKVLQENTQENITLLGKQQKSHIAKERSNSSSPIIKVDAKQEVSPGNMNAQNQEDANIPKRYNSGVFNFANLPAKKLKRISLQSPFTAFQQTGLIQEGLTQASPQSFGAAQPFRLNTMTQSTKNQTNTDNNNNVGAAADVSRDSLSMVVAPNTARTLTSGQGSECSKAFTESQGSCNPHRTTLVKKKKTLIKGTNQTSSYQNLSIFSTFAPNLYTSGAFGNALLTQQVAQQPNQTVNQSQLVGDQSTNLTKSVSLFQSVPLLNNNLKSPITKSPKKLESPNKSMNMFTNNTSQDLSFTQQQQTTMEFGRKSSVGVSLISNQQKDPNSFANNNFNRNPSYEINRIGRPAGLSQTKSTLTFLNNANSAKISDDLTLQKQTESSQKRRIDKEEIQRIIWKPPIRKKTKKNVQVD